jgi:beta-lactamase class A
MKTKGLIRYLLLLTVMFGFVNFCFANHQQMRPSSIQKELTKLEASSGGRLGVFAINTANNSIFQFHARKHFPMCSTAKVMAVSAILKHAMQDRGLLQQKVWYTKDEIDASGYTPMTEKHIVDGMTIGALCDAAITGSDNGAMNLLMKKLGGPSAVTLFARSIGDHQFQLDRYEPELNSANPGDLRDTSTPESMAKSLKRLLFGDGLGEAQQKQLLSWLKKNKTGNKRIRAGVPKGWVVGDKTGTGNYGTTNDIGVILPAKGSPIVVAIYFTQNTKSAAPREDVIASATRILMRSLKVD